MSWLQGGIRCFTTWQDCNSRENILNGILRFLTTRYQIKFVILTGKVFLWQEISPVARKDSFWQEYQIKIFNFAKLWEQTAENMAKCMIINQYLLWLFNPPLEESSNLPGKYPTRGEGDASTFLIFGGTHKNVPKKYY